MKKLTVSQHALDRYMERSGSRNVNKSLAFLFEAASSGAIQPNGRIEHKGWTLVVIDRDVKTVYRATKMENQSTLKKRKFDYA